MTNKKVPLLITFFNRFENLRELLGVIRLYSPDTVYISSDGPRRGIQGEESLIQGLRSFALKELNWVPKIYTKFNDSNLGCKRAVHEAIQWFFLKEKYGIVLEDDIVPTLPFFNYCETALTLYEQDQRIGSITGRNDLGSWGGEDIFFSNRFCSWGWASWSDRILDMDINYGYLRGSSYSELFVKVGYIDKLYIKSVLGYLQNGLVNSWAYPYDLNFKRKGLCHVYPKRNMVKNNGYGASGTHSNSYLQDDAAVDGNFSPNFSNITYNNDREFAALRIKKEYGGYLNLLILQYSRNLGALLKIIRWIKRLRVWQ